MLNNGLRALGRTANATFADAQSFLDSFDSNQDKVISKKEMFNVIKTILKRYSK